MLSLPLTLEIAAATANPFARLKALERIDELSGILTAKDRLRVREEKPASYQPLFQLPDGAAVSVSVNLPERKREPVPVVELEPVKP